MSSPEQTLRFTHVQLTNWMNFAAMDVELQQRVFVVGPNAAGKSNLLDAFRFLADIARRGEGGFLRAVQRRGGVDSLRYLGARKSPYISLSVSVGDDIVARRWEYELTFGNDAQFGPVIRKEIVTDAGGKQLVTRPSPDERKNSRLLTQTHLEQVSLQQDFAPLADFLASVRYQHTVPEQIRQSNRARNYSYPPTQPSFIDEMAATSAELREARLKAIAQTVEAILPQFTQLRVAADPQHGNHLQAKYADWRRRGTWQQEDKLSDGTLRLIGLLWALQQGSGPLLIEEPELSLHYGVIQYVPQLLARVCSDTGRQVIVSTHSTELLKDEGISPAEVLLLVPQEIGTKVEPANTVEDIDALLQVGRNLSEIVLPLTSSANGDELALFEVGAASSNGKNHR